MGKPINWGLITKILGPVFLVLGAIGAADDAARLGELAALVPIGDWAWVVVALGFTLTVLANWERVRAQLGTTPHIQPMHVTVTLLSYVKQRIQASNPSGTYRLVARPHQTDL